MYKNKKWLEEQIKNSTELEIALKCNVSEGTIFRWKKRFCIQKEKPAYQDKEWLTREIKIHGSSAKVAKIYGFNTYTVNDWCNKFGISRAERQKIRNGDLNENFFSVIDEEHKAYWLGFLMADGTMKRDLKNVSINLKESDLSHIELFKKDINSNALISNKIGGFGTPCKEIVICNKKMCIDLNYHGICPRKTGRESLPDTVPNVLIRHFIRGFLDGDGHIRAVDDYRSNLTIDFAGMSRNLFYSMHEYFQNELEIKHDIKIRKGNALHLLYYSSNALKILDHLYENSTIHLDRKYQRYLTKK